MVCEDFSHKKVVVIGLDGATWRIINPLMKKGQLPNFEKLLKKGAHGKLRSTIPPLTPSAWVSFQTGKNPSKHGIFDFGKLNKDYTVTMFNGTDIKSITFYEILHQDNIKCFILNLPYDFPPKIPGDIVFSWLTPTEDNVLYTPKNLHEKIPELRKYYPYPKNKSGKKEFIKEYFNIAALQRKILKRALKADYNFIFVLFSYIDWIQHGYFGLDNDKLIDAYELADSIIGEAIENLNEDDTLIVMSDHGFKDYQDKILLINSWLENQKYLKTSSSGIAPFVMIQNKEYTKRILSAPNLITKNKILFKFLHFFYNKIKLFLPIQFSKMKRIDMNHTKAFSSGRNLIYIHDERFKNGKVKEDEKIPLIEEIITNLKISGFEAYNTSEIYGNLVDFTPDIVLSGVVGTSHFDTLSIKPYWHERDGIFIAVGEDFNNITLDLDITDVATLILYLNNCPVPSDMDGKIPTKIFNTKLEIKTRDFEGHTLHSKPIKNVDIEKIKERLKDLGYI